MSRRVRVVLADLLVAAVVADYLVYLAVGRAWLVTDPRSMAGLGLGLSMAAAAVAVPLVPVRAVAPVVAGGLTLAVGVAGLMWGGVDRLGPVLAGAFVVAVGLTWLLTVLAARAERGRRPIASVARTAAESGSPSPGGDGEDAAAPADQAQQRTDDRAEQGGEPEHPSALPGHGAPRG